MFDGMLERRAGLTKNVAGIEQAIDLRSVPRSLLDLVEIVQVGDQRVGGLLVEVNVVGLRIGHGPIIDPPWTFSTLLASVLTVPQYLPVVRAFYCLFRTSHEHYCGRYVPLKDDDVCFFVARSASVAALVVF